MLSWGKRVEGVGKTVLREKLEERGIDRGTGLKIIEWLIGGVRRVQGFRC